MFNYVYNEVLIRVSDSQQQQNKKTKENERKENKAQVLKTNYLLMYSSNFNRFLYYFSQLLVSIIDLLNLLQKCSNIFQVRVLK